MFRTYVPALLSSFIHHPHILLLTLPLHSRLFFFNDTPPTEIYTLSLHDALPICGGLGLRPFFSSRTVHDEQICGTLSSSKQRSEEHTSELQSHSDLVCRLLLEKKKKKNK